MRAHVSPLPALLVACLGIALFSVMDGVMKSLALAIGAYNAMFWRQVVSISLGGIGMAATRTGWPAPHVLRVHALRGCIGGLMAFTFFWGIARVPLAEGIALSFIAPLITLYLAAVMLRERISRQSILASLLGLAGVMVIAVARLGESAAGTDALWGIASIFLSAVLYAYNLILQRQQAQLAQPVEVAFFMSVFSWATLALAAPWLVVWPDMVHLPAMTVAAILSFLSLMLLAWAYRRAEAQILVPVEYTAFLWAALVGWWAFGEPITPPTIAGTLLIVAGCMIAARQRPDHVETTAV